MKNRKPKIDKAIPAQASIFTHKYGISFGIVPSGIPPEEYWLNDDYNPDDGDTIESYQLPEPWNSAQEMLSVLTRITRCAKVEYAPGFFAYCIGDDKMKQARFLADRASSIKPCGGAVVMDVPQIEDPCARKKK